MQTDSRIFSDIVNRHRLFFLSLVLVGVVFGIYLNTLGYPFVYDDVYFIEQNEYIKSLKNVLHFFVNPDSISSFNEWGAIYRPFRTLSFSLEYALMGNNPQFHRFVNIFLHSVNSVLVFFFILAIRNQRFPLKNNNVCFSFCLALIFAGHPFQTESVIWCSSRDNPLSFLFFISAILIYTRHAATSHGKISGIRLFVSTLLFIAAILSKEAAIVLPLILLLFDHLIAEHRKKLRVYFVLFLVAFLYFCWRFYILGSIAQRDYWGGSFTSTVYSMMHGYAVYLKNLFCPVQLSIEHDLNIVTQPDTTVILMGILIVILASLSVVTYRHRKDILFFLGWTAISLLPVSNIIPITTLIADRFMYYPLIGAGWLILALGEILGDKIGKKGQTNTALWLLYFVLTVFYGSLTLNRSKDWESNEKLWLATLDVYPLSDKAHSQLGIIYNQNNDLVSSHFHSLKALEINDKNNFALRNLGDLAFQRGNYNEAIRYYKRSLRLYPSVLHFRINLAIIYEELGRPHQAIELYQEFISAYGDHVDILFGIGNIYLKMKDCELAIEYFRRSVEKDPIKSPAWNNLGIMYLQLGQINKTREVWQTALRYRPFDSTIKANFEQLDHN